MSLAHEGDLPEPLKRDVLAILGLEHLPPPRAVPSPGRATGEVRARASRRVAATRPVIPRLMLSRTASTSLGAVAILALAGGGGVLLKRTLNERGGVSSSDAPDRAMARPPQAGPAVASPQFDTAYSGAAPDEAAPPGTAAAERRFVPARSAPVRPGGAPGKADAPPAIEGERVSVAAAAAPALPEVAPGGPVAKADAATIAGGAAPAGDPPSVVTARVEDPMLADSTARRRNRLDSIDAMRALRR